MWLPAIGYEGFYEVSDDGHVRSLSRQYVSKTGRKVTVQARKLKVGIVNGYHVVSLSKDGKSKSFRLHCLMMLTFVGPCPSGHEVCHWDGKRDNNHLSNLRYGTKVENMEDRIRHGTQWVKIRKADISDIKRRHSIGHRVSDIANSYRVNKTTIYRHLRARGQLE